MHSIDVILIRRSEFRNIKVNLIINEKFLVSDEISVDLPQNIIAFPSLSKMDICKKFGNGITFVKVETSYFGGSGEQSAELLVSTKNGYKVVKKSDSINEILNIYGVKKISSDEFDAIKLGRYRSNENFIKEYQQKCLIDEIIKTTKSF